ncbi:tetratricopeptide repeat protein [Ningiella sp. W23]|uniref:tetratricopeptide repeat protein n=1 Tax=Ningiella sp. W23 TaxID=3023715 RepID=UPI0037584439
MTDIVKFARWEFDQESGELVSSEHIKRLEPIVAKLLSYLLVNQNRVVRRDELIEHVWENRIVSDDPINRSISILRQTLSPENKQAYIQTVPRRGYITNFGDVSVVVKRQRKSANDKNGAKSFSLAQKRYLAFLFLLPLSLLAFFMLALNEKETSVEKKGIPRVAVLPFSDLSKDNNYDYLAKGVSDTIIHIIGRVDGIEVTASTSSFSYQNSNKSIAQIARELDVEFVVEGSIQPSNDKLRVITRLVQVDTESEIWTSNITRNLSNIFSIQDEIANALVVSMKGTVLKGGQSYQPQFETYELLLRGISYANKMTDASRERALDLFKQAIENEPDYALPYVHMARILHQQFTTNTYAHAYPNTEKSALINEAKALLSKAINLDPFSSEAHNLQGLMDVFNADNKKAIESFERAIELNPNNSKAFADYADLLNKEGRTEDALRQARRAYALDPNSSQISYSLATILWTLGRLEEAIQVIKKNIEKYPSAVNNHSLLSRWYLQKGEPAQSVMYAIKERELDPNNPNRHWLVCLGYYQIWDEQSAHECSRELLTTFPDYYEANKWLHMKEFEKVYQIISEQIAIYPNSPYYRLQLADVLQYKERPQEVLDLLKPYFSHLFAETPTVSDWDLWAIRLIAQAWKQKGETTRANTLLSHGVEHIDKSRQFMGGGFSSGIDDVYFLILLDKHQEALRRLKLAIDSRWSFYSYSLPYDPIFADFHGKAEFDDLVEKHRLFFKSERKHLDLLTQ